MREAARLTLRAPAVLTPRLLTDRLVVDEMKVTRERPPSRSGYCPAFGQRRQRSGQ